MRIIVCLLVVVGVAYGQSATGEAAAPADPAAAPADPAAAPADPAAAPAKAAQAAPKPTNPYGPNFFGPGLNNPSALPPNPLHITRAQTILRHRPNLRALVDQFGLITITDQFGQQSEALDSLGRELNSFFKPTAAQKLQIERLEQEQERAEKLLEARIEAQLATLSNLQAGDAVFERLRQNPSMLEHLLRTVGGAGATGAGATGAGATGAGANGANGGAQPVASLTDPIF